MRSPSSFSASGAIDRDAALVGFVDSIVGAARQTWRDRIIAEGDGSFDPRQLYTETHYTLAAVLLFCRGQRDTQLLDLAESRLRLWATGTYPLTFFNAMAICLTAIVMKQVGVRHQGLQAILDALIGQTREHRHVAFPQWCGNNAYLQQVAIDTVLLPVARGSAVEPAGIELLLREFRSFRTPEGFFFDLPRTGTDQERLCPPTYVMKMLFLLGVCHTLQPVSGFADLFRAGMASTLPLLSGNGHFSYYGRTDNSPFAAGLTIFNLRKAAHLAETGATAYDDACSRAEQFYLTFPRAASGVLESTRFGDAKSAAEAYYSKDAYAYVAQYSLASSAYAMLAAQWFPAQTVGSLPPTCRPEPREDLAVSRDLGLVRIAGPEHELIVRTESQMTSWDRRYLGPTILRYSRGDELLVGAISRTVSTDLAPRSDRPSNRLLRIVDLFRHRYTNGAEHLDAVTVGYVPVLRNGATDWVPYRAMDVATSPGRVVTRHGMERVRVRGFYPCMVEALQLAHGNVPGLKPKRYVRPPMRPADGIQLERSIQVDARRCRIEDRITGAPRTARLLFSVRRLPSAIVDVDGLTKRQTIVGWGSDGRHTLDIYESPVAHAEVRYACEIREA